MGLLGVSPENEHQGALRCDMGSPCAESGEAWSCRRRARAGSRYGSGPHRLGPRASSISAENCATPVGIRGPCFRCHCPSIEDPRDSEDRPCPFNNPQGVERLNIGAKRADVLQLSSFFLHCSFRRLVFCSDLFGTAPVIMPRVPNNAPSGPKGHTCWHFRRASRMAVFGALLCFGHVWRHPCIDR